MKFPVALQLYSIRTDMEKDVLSTLKAVKEMGYDGVELAGFYGIAPAQMKAYLDEVGLIPVSAHVPIAEMLADVDKVIADYKTVGVQYIVVPYLDEARRPGNEGFGQCVEDVKRLAKICAENGLPLQYHNHDFEFKTVDGEYGLDIFLSSAPELGLELDTCWAAVAGVNVGKYLRSYKGRTPVLHLKDYYKSEGKAGKLYNLIGIDDNAAPEEESSFEFRPLGKGMQDVDALLCAARNSGVKWVVIEQDEPSMGLSRLECAKQGIEYLKTLNPQTTLRMGVVGAGNIYTNGHAGGYAKIKNAKVVAVADINEERARVAAEKLGVPYFTSVEEMCAETEIDAVDICTWNNGHAPVCIAAAKAGKHVLCEKPMARSADEARAMEKAVKDAGVRFMLAVPGRFGNANCYIRELYEKGELGDVYYGKTAYVRRRGTPTGWFTDLEHAGGGPVYDIGIHGIDAAWYLMGTPKPTRVSAIVNTKIGDYQTKGVTKWKGTPCPDNQFNVEDSGMGVIHFENGAMLSFEATWAINAPDGSSTLVCGTKAGATVSPLTIYGEREGYLSTDSIKVLDNDRFASEIEHFADKVLNGGEVRYPIEQAIQMQEMLDAIYLSGKEGREVII
ncbi:MAG: Gfo/Idh/MocA family oxidoreductase [Clostridia bacterium]|nr:Gfo/Idh/MocA family oxidoreductase [Clostridia bacterium]